MRRVLGSLGVVSAVLFGCAGAEFEIDPQEINEQGVHFRLVREHPTDADSCAEAGGSWEGWNPQYECPEGLYYDESLSDMDGAICCMPEPYDPSSCLPIDAAPEGPCAYPLGVFFDGSSCWMGSGCSCVGQDCDEVYSSIEECELAHAYCIS